MAATAHPVAAPQPAESLFVSSLSAACADALRPHLKPVHLVRGTVLAGPATSVVSVYFPVTAVVSTVTRMLDGGSVEVGVTGPEGLCPLSLAFGDRTSPHTTVVQVSGSALRIPAARLDELAGGDAGYRAQLLRYGEYIFSSAAQFAACSQLHPIEARYARSLLMVADRTGPRFLLTQEYSAEMLGVRRAGVTVVAGRLRQAGSISYRRGEIVVLDRAALESAACECYGVVNAELKRLLGLDLHSNGPEPVAS